MADLLDTRIAQAKARVIGGEAEDADWMILILDRQCSRLDTIIENIKPLRQFEADRRFFVRLLSHPAAPPLLAMLGGGGVAGIMARGSWP